MHEYTRKQARKHEGGLLNDEVLYSRRSILRASGGGPARLRQAGGAKGTMQRPHARVDSTLEETTPCRVLPLAEGDRVDQHE